MPRRSIGIDRALRVVFEPNGLFQAGDEMWQRENTNSLNVHYEIF
jgi:hypothetical protein